MTHTCWTHLYFTDAQQLTVVADVGITVLQHDEFAGVTEPCDRRCWRAAHKTLQTQCAVDDSCAQTHDTLALDVRRHYVARNK